MSVESKIVAALKPFGDPVRNGFYKPTDPREYETGSYYTFNVGAVGTDYGDDAPNHDLFLVQVHFFCPLTFNSINRVKDTKKALFEAGFTWPSKHNATDEEGQHIVFECQIAEGVDVDGLP